jgi:hypothetical protein
MNLKILKGRPSTSFLFTTLFNFSTISLLILAFHATGLPSIFVTGLSQFLGILISMFFTLDFWWKRVSNEIDTVTIQMRIEFLRIAMFSAFVSLITTSLLIDSSVPTPLSLLLVNWLTLGFIALTKYVFFSKRIIQKSSFT